MGSYAYPAGGSARPHAVSGITGTVNGVVNPTYTFDANGNMTAGAGRTVAYTAFNMTTSITQGSTTISLTYDADHNRVQMVGPPGTTTYLNDAVSGAMAEKLVLGTTTTWHDYIAAGGRIVAEKFSGGATNTRYILADHLGSTAVVMDETGAVVERNAYDAWGRRRNPDGSDDNSCSLTSQTTRGYTGHEQIDAACLINANARIYDATLGKFMSPDSIIPNPFDGQSFNRYAYVNNNPLSATDPSGHGNIVQSTLCDASCAIAEQQAEDLMRRYSNNYCPSGATCYFFDGFGNAHQVLGGDKIEWDQENFADNGQSGGVIHHTAYVYDLGPSLGNASNIFGGSNGAAPPADNTLVGAPGGARTSTAPGVPSTIRVAGRTQISGFRWLYRYQVYDQYGRKYLGNGTAQEQVTPDIGDNANEEPKAMVRGLILDKVGYMWQPARTVEYDHQEFRQSFVIVTGGVEYNPPTVLLHVLDIRNGQVNVDVRALP